MQKPNAALQNEKQTFGATAVRIVGTAKTTAPWLF